MKDLKYRKIGKIEKGTDGYTLTVKVKIQNDVWQRMVQSGWCGFVCPTENEGFVTVCYSKESRWEWLLTDECQDFMEN